MKSFTFTTLAALLISAAQAESIMSETSSAIDMTEAAQLEHKHVSNISKEIDSAEQDFTNAINQRNAEIRADFKIPKNNDIMFIYLSYYYSITSTTTTISKTFKLLPQLSPRLLQPRLSSSLPRLIH
jgi:hypothetical protein